MTGPRRRRPSVRRNLYLTQRTMGDIQAARRGTLPRRVVRRLVTRRIMSRLWGR